MVRAIQFRSTRAAALIIDRYTSTIIRTSLLAYKRAASRGLRGLSGYSIACARVTREFKVMHIYRFVSPGERKRKKRRKLAASCPLSIIPLRNQDTLFPFPRSGVVCDFVAEPRPDATGRHVYRSVSVLGSRWNVIVGASSTCYARVRFLRRLHVIEEHVGKLLAVSCGRGWREERGWWF